MTQNTNAPDRSPLRPAIERRALLWVLGVLTAVVIAVVLVGALFDWNWIRGPIARYASAATGRRVRIDGDLKVHLLTKTPTVSVSGLKIGQPAWAAGSDMAVVDKLVVQARWPSLIQGKPALRLVELDHPNLDLRRDSHGRTNWSLSSPSNSGVSRLPLLEHLIIRAGRVHYEDAQRKAVVEGVFNSNESAGGSTAHAFNFSGNGVLNARPFQLRIQGGPLINVKADQPYPFSASIAAEDTRVEAQGALRRPFDFSGYDAVVHVTGRDMADLYYLTGLTLPNTPAYDLRGAMRHSAKLYGFDNLAGRIGASEVTGDFSVSTASVRPFVDAHLRSRSLDFRDLNTIFGGAPSKASMAGVKPEVRAAAARRSAEHRIFPDAPLYSDRLRHMDAKLDFRAASIIDSPLPLRRVDLKLTLDHGLLVINPLNAGFARGGLHATIVLDARGATPATDLDVRLIGFDLKSLFPNAKRGEAPVEGMLAARAKLRGVGDSVRKTAATSNGQIAIVTSHGQIRSAFAELLGVNVGKSVSLLLSNNNGESKIRCGVAAFDVHEGQLNAREILLDTDVVRVSGSGGANLSSETFGLVLTGDSKKFRMTHVFLPITIGGHFRNPTLGVQPGAAIAQVGAALALGALFSPLAAILPFVDLGLAKDADCQAALAESHVGSAPTKAALRAGHGEK